MSDGGGFSACRLVALHLTLYIVRVSILTLNVSTSDGSLFLHHMPQLKRHSNSNTVIGRNELFPV